MRSDFLPTPQQVCADDEHRGHVKEYGVRIGEDFLKGASVHVEEGRFRSEWSSRDCHSQMRWPFTPFGVARRHELRRRPAWSCTICRILLEQRTLVRAAAAKSRGLRRSKSKERSARSKEQGARSKEQGARSKKHRVRRVQGLSPAAHTEGCNVQYHEDGEECTGDRKLRLRPREP